MYIEGLKSNVFLCFLCNLIVMIIDIMKMKLCFLVNGDFKYIGRNF